MVSFRVPTSTNQFIVVEVYESEKGFKRAVKKRFDLDDVRACCKYWPQTNKLRDAAIIVFCGKELTIELITHEFIHAFTGICAQNQWDIYDLKHNELFATAFGDAIHFCCEELKLLGFKIV